MEPSTPALLERTSQPRYPNGERNLAQTVFMQTPWSLLALTALGQLLLLVWLDLMS